MRVVVIGAGHVGLVTAGALASFGHDVVAVDEDEEKINGLGSGVLPFFEPGLQELVGGAVSSGCLRFAVEPADVLGDADVVFLCVGTPARASGEANLVWVERAARSIAGHLARPIVVVEKSTVQREPPNGCWRCSGCNARILPVRSRSSPTRSSSARVRRSRTPCSRIGSSWVPDRLGDSRRCGASTSR